MSENHEKLHDSSVTDPESVIEVVGEPTPTQSAPTVQESEWNRDAILTLIGSTSVIFCTVGLVNAFGVFQTYYAETLLSNSSPSQISWIGSFNVFTLFFGTFPVGYLNVKYGHKILLPVGSVIFLFAFFMTSLCKEFYQFFLAQAFLLGIGIAIILTPAISMPSQHFIKNRGLALGICVAGSSLGGVFWPIVFNNLFREVGFGWGVRIGAFIMLPLLAIACVTIRLPKKQTNMPKPKPDFSIFRDPVLILLAVGLFFIYLGLFTPFFYITSYSISLGFDANISFYMISILNAASLFGRVLPGFIADHVGFINVLIFAVIISAIIACCMTKATSLGGVIVLSLAYGFFSGSVISLQAACAASQVKPHQIPFAVGAVLALLSIAALIGTPIVGQILLKFNYLGIALFSGLSMFVGAIFLILARLKKTPKTFAKA
ncbi:MFS monocarboxylate transporter-like protein [Halenospora varia]|nr:MFS monocarboxylate transporter-like protein [Halenospora varia]